MYDENKLKAEKLNQELNDLESSLMVFDIETIVEETFKKNKGKNVRFYFDLNDKRVYTKDDAEYKDSDIFLVEIPKETIEKALKNNDSKNYLIDDLERHWGDICKHTMFRYSCKKELKMSKEAIQYENLLEKAEASKNYFDGEFTPKIIDENYTREKLIKYLDEHGVEDELVTLSGLWAAFAYKYGEDNGFKHQVNRSFAYMVSSLLTGVGRATGTHMIFDEDKIEKTLRKEAIKIEKEDLKASEKYKKFFFKIFDLYKNNIDDYKIL